MSVLQVDGLGKMFNGEYLWRDISFRIGEGEKVALVGPNGCGKTTLIRCLEEKLTPDEGNIFFARNRFVASLAQDQKAEEASTLRDYMLAMFDDVVALSRKMGALTRAIGESPDPGEQERLAGQLGKASERYEILGGYSVEARVREMVFGLGFREEDMDRTLSQFSGGQKTRIGLARSLLRKPDILILDEPNNYLDLDALAWLEGFLAGYPGAILVVSHDRYFLDQVVERVLEFENGHLYSYPGNYSRFVEQKELQIESHNKAVDKQEKKIADTEDYVRRYGAGIKSKQARGRQRQLDRMDRLQRRGEVRRESIGFSRGVLSGEKVLRIRGLSVGYPGKPLLTDVHKDILREDRIALVGPNGCGKSTFLKALVGEHPYEGRLIRGANVETGWFSQEHETVPTALSVLDTLMDEGVETEEEARRLLARFGFRGEDVFKLGASLSGGEKSRLALAVLFFRRPNLLILDEPTNHLDIYSREHLEEALEEYDGTLLFVSHDRYFLSRMARSFWVFEEGSLVEVRGGYGELLAWKTKREDEHRQEEKRRTEQERQAGATGSAAGRTESAGDRKQQRIRRADLTRVEGEITRLEEALAALNGRLSDPELYDNPREYEKAQEAFEETQEDLGQMMEKWEQLMAD